MRNGTLQLQAWKTMIFFLKKSPYISEGNLQSPKNKFSAEVFNILYSADTISAEVFNMLHPAWKLLKWGKSRPSLCMFLKRSDKSLEKKASRTFHGYIWYFTWLICMKNREFWEVQKIIRGIRALYPNRDGYSYIRVAFRELYSEKTASGGEHVKLYSGKPYSSFLHKKALQGGQVTSSYTLFMKNSCLLLLCK